ncbi:hypothetical protein KP509_14G081600 [Ceratopteris richardii]|uniref:Uncharacterized protein n=1 Tax=Ceratopteris richardii TaxID=49495 RepID=A0A8T2TGV1_CERRI|nr:hypothetical protein KP509_14G081600 [Ceratopteris richardii]
MVLSKQLRRRMTQFNRVISRELRTYLYTALTQPRFSFGLPCSFSV